MDIKKFILLIFVLAALPTFSTEREREPTEAMQLLGIVYGPIQLELQNFGEVPNKVDSDLPDRSDINKSHKPQASPLDNILDFFTSIKAQLFDSQTSQVDSTQLLIPQ